MTMVQHDMWGLKFTKKFKNLDNIQLQYDAELGALVDV